MFPVYWPHLLQAIDSAPYAFPAYRPIDPLRIDGSASEVGGSGDSTAKGCDHATHVTPTIGQPAERAEVVGQMLGREQLVRRFQRGAEVGDRGVDGEKRRAPLTFRPLAAGNGSDVGAPALSEDVERWCAVTIHQRTRGEVGIAKSRRRFIAEAVD